MDFLSLLQTNSSSLIQIGYVAILMFAAVILLPRLLSEHSKERKEFLSTIQDTNDKFLAVIESYREALTTFQQHEDESHANLVNMIKDCRTSVAEEHKELLRALKTIAKELNTELIE